MTKSRTLADLTIPSGTPVGTTDTQTLTNKTLTAPTIASANLTTALTVAGTAGNSGQVLTSGGSGAAPSWATVSSGLSAATQAQMEAASSNAVAVTPLSANWHPSAAKLWLRVGSLFNSGTIMASHNVTSVVDGTGALTVTIATDFSSSNYVVVATPEYSQPNNTADKLTCGVQRGTMDAGSFQVLCVNYQNTLFDPDYYMCVAFGDQ